MSNIIDPTTMTIPTPCIKVILWPNQKMENRMLKNFLVVLTIDNKKQLNLLIVM